MGWMNNRGEVAGFAENTVRDPECLAAAPNGTGPQIFDYEAVIWGPATRPVPAITAPSWRFCGVSVWYQRLESSSRHFR